MSEQLHPGDALDASSLYSLYLGGLAFESERRRRLAAGTLLLGGRLGLRIGELQHLHEGWVDWQRGTVRIPAHEPCACETCWEAARHAQRTGDGRSLVDIVAETRWSPPAGEARTLSFGWSNRLTALLAHLFDEEGMMTVPAEQVLDVLAGSAERARGIDAEAVDVRTLRASAASFHAEAGFNAVQVGNLLGVDTETAIPFTRAEGGYARDHLSRTFDGQSPSLCGEDPAYPLVCDPTPFEHEPFDTAAYDADWRRDRAARTDDDRVLRNPRPTAVPDGIDFDPDDVSPPNHLDPDSDAVAVDGDGLPVETLDAWVSRQEASRHEGHAAPGGSETASASGTGAETATAGGAGTAAAGDGAASGDGATAGGTPETGADDEGVGTALLDPREALTEPVVAEVSTMFACSTIEDGTPTTGRVMLGQNELLLLCGEEGTVTDHDEISLETVADVSLDYVPDNMEEMFDSTVGVAYEQADGRRLAVLELPGKKQLDFSAALFKRLLDDTSVVVTHPARTGGRVTDEEPRERSLSLHSRKLAVGRADDDDPEFGIRLSDVIHVERSTQSHGEDRRRGLSIRHLRPDGQAVTTEIAPKDTDGLKLLERFVMRNYRQRKEEVTDLDLSADQKEVLVALYSTGGGMDITMILDKDSDELSGLLASLKKNGLVRTSGDGARLTGTGQMVVSDKVDDVNV